MTPHIIQPNPLPMGDKPLSSMSLIDLVPRGDEGQPVSHYVDGAGTVHWLAATAVEGNPLAPSPSELRYSRTAYGAGGEPIISTQTVMPLDSPSASPFPRPILELMLREGDLDNMQEFAYHTAQGYGLNFPDPADLPDLNPRVDYFFDVAVAADGSPTVEAVKTWMDGSERRYAALTLATYGMEAEATRDEAELAQLLQREGAQPAMRLAERMAVASGHLMDARDDPRLFTDGPPDTFTTYREQALQAERMYGEVALPLIPLRPEPEDPAITRFREHFADTGFHLLQPLDPVVNYSLSTTDVDPWTHEVMLDKWWFDEQGRVDSDSLTVSSFYKGDYESDFNVRLQAQVQRDLLLMVYQADGLTAMMQEVEQSALAAGELEPDRQDGRLFPSGPPDRFTTLRERELEAMSAATQPAHPFVVSISSDETRELPAAMPEPDTWEELLARYNQPTPQVEPHYWRLDPYKVNTPDGQPLGVALFMTEYPQLPPDFDQYVEANGISDAEYPTEARTLELAHFSTEAEARHFEKEFRQYLVPEILDGPELASEVARQEGLSGTWADMDYWGIVETMSSDRTITRAPEDWHLHDPHAEREVRNGSDGFQFDIEY